MDLSDPWLIVNHNPTSSICDDKFVLKVFDAQRMQLLREAQEKHPNSIIRSTNSLCGSVPENWDGTYKVIPGV